MYLHKAIKKAQFGNALLYSNMRCFSSAKHYDVAIIGGGPGGKNPTLKQF